MILAYSRLLPRLVAACAVALVVAFVSPETALAQKGGDSTPKPKVDCSLAKNKRNAACAKKSSLSDDELFQAGYWLARGGHYAEAIDFLGHARNADDARILTYLGFSHRKLGAADVAMGYYARALAANPDYTIARAYLGEAHLAAGRVAEARSELGEIARRCGTTCEEYLELQAAISTHAG
jgi:tetratricopeptide (TPR) repeat protein